MNWRSFLPYRLLLCMVLLCSFCCITVYADSEDGGQFQIDVIYGNEGRMHSDRYVPVSVRLYQVTKDFSGEIRLTVPYTERDYLLYTKDIFVESGKEQTVDFVVPLQKNVSKLRIQILDGAGKLQYEYDMYIPSSISTIGQQSDYDLALCIVAEESSEGLRIPFREQLDFSEDMTTAVIRPFIIQPQNFPEDFWQLQMYDVTIISEGIYHQLNEQQLYGLRTWVSSGGILVFLGGDIENAKEAGLALTDMESSIGSGSYCYFGEGACFVFEKDFYSDGLLTDSLFGQMLQLIYGEILPENFSVQYAKGGFRPAWKEQLSEYLFGWEYSVPNVKLYIYIIVIYIFLALPAGFLFLRNIKKSYYLRGTVISLAVLFSLVIYVVGGNTRMNIPRVTAFAVENVAGNAGSSYQVYASVQTPYDETLMLSVSEDWTSGIVMPENSYEVTEWNRVDDSAYAMIYTGKPEMTYFVGSHTVGTNYIAFQKKTSTLEAAFVYDKEMKTVTNQSQRDFLGVWMISEKGCLLLPELSAGDTAVLLSDIAWQPQVLEETMLQIGMSQKLTELFMVYYQNHSYYFTSGTYFIGLYQETEGEFLKSTSNFQYQGYGIVIQSCQE